MSVFQQGNTWLTAARQRAKQGIMQAMGSQSSSEDQEYEEKFRNFTAHTQELARMKELMEIWVDSFDAFCKATSLLSEGFKQFHSSNPYYNGEENETLAGKNGGNSTKFPFSPVATQLDEISICIDERIRPAIVSTFQSRCIKPLSSILSLVPPLQEHHQIRKTLLTEFDLYRLKMEKEFAVGRDSSHPNVMRKAAKLDESAKKLHSVQSLLFQKFYEFETARNQTLGPELGVYVSCLYSFASLMHSELSELLPFIPQSATTLAALDAANLNPVSSTVTHRLTKPIPSMIIGTKPHFPAEIISSRPISAGGSIGGYGTIAAQDYHNVVSTSLVDIDNPIKQSKDNEWSNDISPNAFFPSNSVSSHSNRAFSEFSSPASSNHPSGMSMLTDNRERVNELSEGILREYESSSRPVSEITMGTFSSSARDSLVTIIEQSTTFCSQSDSCVPPPKPPRKDRQTPSATFPGVSSTMEHLEVLKEVDEENSLANSSHVSDANSSTPK